MNAKKAKKLRKIVREWIAQTGRAVPEVKYRQKAYLSPTKVIDQGSARGLYHDMKDAVNKHEK